MVSSSFVRTAVTLVAVVASALAAPAVMEPVDASSIEQVADASVAICAGLMKKAVCCEGSVLGLVHTGCVAPFPPPQTAVDFVEQCASEAKAAQCCTLNLVSFLFLLLPAPPPNPMPACLLSLSLSTHPTYTHTHTQTSLLTM